MSPPGAIALRVLRSRDVTGSRVDDAPLCRFFEAAVGVMCESRSVGRVHRPVDGPGPTAKSGSLVIKEGLTKSGVIVHDKGTLLGDWFTDGATLKDETVGTAR
jgi:hypothetical protein